MRNEVVVFGEAQWLGESEEVRVMWDGDGEVGKSENMKSLVGHGRESGFYSKQGFK